MIKDVRGKNLAAKVIIEYLCVCVLCRVHLLNDCRGVYYLYLNKTVFSSANYLENSNCNFILEKSYFSLVLLQQGNLNFCWFLYA